jgi:hypothetical protein
MRRFSNPIRIQWKWLTVFLSLAISSIAQVSGQIPRAPTEGAFQAAPSAQEVPPCAPALSSHSRAERRRPGPKSAERSPDRGSAQESSEDENCKPETGNQGREAAPASTVGRQSAIFAKRSQQVVCYQRNYHHVASNTSVEPRRGGRTPKLQNGDSLQWQQQAPRKGSTRHRCAARGDL